MNNFTVRAITGIVFVAVIVASVWLSYESMLLLFALITMLGLWEFYSLLEKSGHQPNKFFSMFVCLFCWITLFPGCMSLLPGLLLVPPALLIVELYKKNSAPFINVAYTLFGLIYIILPFYLLAWHALNFYPVANSHDDNNFSYSYYPYLILGVFFLIWANDTFAYLSGKMFGKTKLFERISPKKTWEGTIGGGVCTVITALVLSRFFTEYNWNEWMLIAVIVVAAGTLGDLVESMFKRSINVKDSGKIIPGHGGILDRFDSYLLAAPIVFIYVWFF